MPTPDTSRAEIFIYVFKEGALSALGHDLKLKVASFDLSADSTSVSVDVSLDTIEILGSVKNGRIAEGDLSAKDKRDIHGNMTKDVLHTKKHPRARFTSSSVVAKGDGFRVDGTLDLHGTRRPMGFDVERRGDGYAMRVRLGLRDFGMKPYKALLGAIKTKEYVEVEAVVPTSGE